MCEKRARLPSPNLVNLSSIRICNEDRLEALYTDTKDEYLENGKTNIFVAALTTCQAQLKLYSYLNRLQQQVLYFDTDSVIYSHRPGQHQLATGDYLGDLTDELDANEHIVDFASGGPKNYGYRTVQGKVECEVRGFTLGHARGHAQLNCDILKQNVLDELQQPMDEPRIIQVRNPHFFTRHPATKDIHVLPRNKGYSLVFDKRVVDPTTFKSYPYGYTTRDFRTLPEQEWQSPLPDEDTMDSNNEVQSNNCVCVLFEDEPCTCFA